MTDEVQDNGDDLLMPAAPSAGRKPEVRQHKITDAFSHEVAFKVGFVGLGQGGGRMAETFYNLGYRRVCAINSALADLSDLRDEIVKLDLGTGGAGQDIEKGRQSIENRQEDVWETLERAIGEDVDFLIVCASLGGGTGSGGCDTLVGICRDYMEQQCEKNPKRVGALVSLPNTYEGQRTCRNAVKAFQLLAKKQPSPFLIIDNKRVEELYLAGSTELYSTCNKQVAGLFNIFNKLAAQRSRLITFDRSDLAALLDSGVVVLGASPITKYESKADISEAIRDQLADTVLAEVDIKGGKAAGCIFLGSEEILSGIPMEFFGGGFSMLSRQLADDSVVFRGVYKGSANDLRCYTMISALPYPTQRLQELARAARMSGEDGGMADYLHV